MNAPLAAWFSDADLSAIALSLRVSLTATLLMLIPGVLLAVWLARTRSRLRPVVEIATMTPLVIPPVVTGFVLLRLMVWLGFPAPFTASAAVLAAAIVATPLLVRTVRAVVEQVDPRYAQVAATLGASRLRILLTITLPLSWRGIVGGASLAFARALGEFGATIIVAGNYPGRTTTIPLAIWTSIQSTEDISIGPLIIAAVLLSVAAVALSELLVRRPGGRGSDHA